MASDFCNFILVGEEEKFAGLKEQAALPEGCYSTVWADDSKTQSRLAVSAVSSGKADLLMKGSVKTGDLMRAVLDKEYGLSKGSLLSHLIIPEKPGGGFMLVSDGGMVISPGLEEKIGITENAVETARGLGIKVPKVWFNFLSPEQAVQALELSFLAQKGRFGEVKIFFDPSPEYFPPDFDIAVVPSLEAGNLAGKSLMYLAGLNSAMMVAGARVPIIVTSRVDKATTRFNSLVLCLYLAGKTG